MAVSHDLRLERVYDAAPVVVFDAFTDPDAQRELYADAPDWIVESECDLRVGGRWSIAFGPAGSTPAHETNVFEVVDRPATGLRLDDDDAGWIQRRHPHGGHLRGGRWRDQADDRPERLPDSRAPG